MSTESKVNTKCQHQKKPNKDDKVSFCKKCGVIMTDNVSYFNLLNQDHLH